MAAVVGGGLRSDIHVSLSDDRVPLLIDQDGDEVPSDLRDLQEEFESEYALRTPPTSELPGDQPALRMRRKHYSGNEMIVAVFVVAFDTRKGNVVEWCHPSEVNTEGVEFKSIASGLHNIQKDFIYFKHNQLFGLSCYEKIPVANQEERGARMRSVGLLAVGYEDLYTHMSFLQRQVRVQVETPGEYGSLEEYFRHYQSPRQPLIRPINDDRLSSSFVEVAPSEVSHPPQCFSQFLEFFGPKVFLLWKLALLKKRIILFSPPPVGEVCHRVYCVCLLTAHNQLTDVDTDCNPQFYINVADIDQIQTLGHYVACTTEKIFQTKPNLFDVFIDCHELSSPLSQLEPILCLTEPDLGRFQLLRNIGSGHTPSHSGRAVGTDDQNEQEFFDFFKELNSQLFRAMQDAASSEDHVMTTEMIDGLGLDPVRDRVFLTELASLHRFNINVQRSSEMFDVFSCCY